MAGGLYAHLRAGRRFQRRSDEDGHDAAKRRLRFLHRIFGELSHCGNFASTRCATFVRRVDKPPTWRQDVVMIVILLIISSAFAILLAAGEFIG
jgi:hypothetical protein